MSPNIWLTKIIFSTFLVPNCLVNPMRNCLFWFYNFESFNRKVNFGVHSILLSFLFHLIYHGQYYCFFYMAEMVVRGYHHVTDTHTEKLSIRICKESEKIESWLLLIDLFDMLTQAIKFCNFHCLILKRTDI